MNQTYYSALEISIEIGISYRVVLNRINELQLFPKATYKRTRFYSHEQIRLIVGLRNKGESDFFEIFESKINLSE